MELGNTTLDTDARTVVFGRPLAPPDPLDFAGRELANAARSLRGEGAEGIEFSLPVGLSESQLRGALELRARAAQEVGLPASIRTADATIARAAAESGMALIHDESGAISENMAAVAREFHLPLILTNRRATGLLPDSDCAEQVLGSLLAQSIVADAAGVVDIWLSPGLGQDLTAIENAELLGRLPLFLNKNRTVLITIEPEHQLPGLPSGQPSRQVKVGAFVAACTIAAEQGVHVISTTEVRGAVAAARVVALFGRGGHAARESGAGGGLRP